MQDSPDCKKPCKGILKNSSSFDKPTASYRKSAKFDELNVLKTYHPHDKDYGHMKIDEPKTPFNYDNPEEPVDILDANLLAEKLRIAAKTQSPTFGAEDSSEEEIVESAEEKIRRLEFEKRRKAHYKEFEAVKLARKLIEEELADVDDDDDEATDNVKTESEAERTSLDTHIEQKSSKIASSEGNPQMEVDTPVLTTRVCPPRTE